MKILVVSYNFGKTSSGKITERMVDKLHENGNEIYLICGNNYCSSKPYSVKTINPNPVRPSSFFKILGNYINHEINYFFWEFRAKRFCLNFLKKKKIDFIYSRGSPISSLKVGDFLKQKTKILHFVHFADPMPPTLDWMKNNLERRKILKTITPIIYNADACFFSNDAMLNYQYKNLMISYHKDKNFITPNPMQCLQYFGKPNHEKIIFSYVGTFAKQRNPELVCKAFLEFSKDKEDVEFHIYGDNLRNDYLKKYVSNKTKIKIFNYEKNVSNIYKKTNILIDIDSNAEENVFISGKLNEYLCCDRYILLITQKNSPSYNLVCKMKNSVLFSNINFSEIVSGFNSMYKKLWTKIDFLERKKIYNDLNINNIVYKLELNFKKKIGASKAI